MALLTSFWLLSVFLMYCSISVTHTDVVYVQPSETVSMNCNSFQPCVTFTDYIANKSIVDNTTFIFLCGTHHLNIPLNLVNLSNVSFLGLDELQGEVGVVQLLLSPLVNITWTDCDGVEIRHLTFILNGQPGEDFSALVFEGTNGTLSQLTFLGNSSMVRGVFLNDSSYVRFSDVFVSGATSSRGPGLYGINSIVDFHGQNSFVDNAATYEGGAIALHDCTLNFGGRISFQNNTAACGGAVFTFGGSQNLFGYILFINNTARTEFYNTATYYTNISVCMSHATPPGLGGGMLIYSGKQNITGNISFTNNKAFSGGALWIANSTILVVSENISFIHNTANFIGGAISMVKVNHTMFGTASFLHNSATFKGGAVSVDGGRYYTSGNILFMNNTAKNGGAMSVIGSNHSSIGKISFVNNVATNGSGGALLISDGRHNITGNISFVNNSAYFNASDFRGGGAMSMANGSHCITGYVTFINNSAPNGNGGAMSLSNISSNISGDVFFISNTAMYDGGALVLYNGTSSISGNISFMDNSVSSRNGGAMSINQGQINISGNSSFVHNIARYEAGALELYRSTGVISGYTSFINNSVLYAYGSGGAVEMDTINGESLAFTGIQKFVENSAERGGAMAFFGRYKLILTSPIQALFIKNHAIDYGGAIYFADDTSARVQCSVPYFSRDNCHMELSSTSNIHLNFSHNTAGSAGTILYGGGLDTCKLYTGGGYRKSDGEILGGSYSYDPPGTIRNISNIISNDNVTSDISSNRLKVCICEGKRLECESLQRAVVRGQKFTLLASVVGQNNEFVSNSPVRISLEDDVQINPAQRLQEVKKECAPISYRLLSHKNQTSVTLSPDNSVCQGGMRVNVTFIPCPDAFTQSGSECVCDSRLHRYNTTCNVDDSSITRSTNTFWMKPLYDGEIYIGLIIHSGCPFDYCVDTQVNITFNDLDAQCNHNHSGMLCGSCRNNFSIALGTLHCLPCTNNYLALLLPFALAGVLLVAVLLLLQLSVANGTINGLIFFANIVQANRSEFFPLGDTNILTIFIAWLNLDLGIETCFYDGMTTYVYAWLQFLFPFYVWFLIALIIVASRYSRKIAGCLGNNPVAVLATLFLLSYSKILHNIITGLSLTRLEYPDSNKYVWLYDGSVSYFQSADHIALGVFAILVFILLFFPYTLLLLCSPWLLTYSHWQTLSWLNKIKPFLDAYYGPYKKNTRYWTGLLLLVRCILFLAFALNTLSNSKFDLLLVTSLTSGVVGLAWVHRGVYEKLYNDVIKASFIINLCVLAAATYHVKETGGSLAGLTYTSTGIAFATFVCILLFHIFVIIRKTPEWKKISKKYKVSHGHAGDDCLKKDKEELADLDKSTTVTTTEFELREPLLI